MYALIISAALGLVAEPPTAVDTADVIEVNHYYDEHGKLVFDQIIFWEWHDELSAYRVIAWRFVKAPSQLPWRDWRRGGYVAIWLDGDVLRQVRSVSSRETWTQHDPEVHDRQFHSQADRRGLIQRAGKSCR